MIKYFTVENFRSLKHESILAFDANLKPGTHYPAHPLCGLAGANASGKTALLQAISYVFWFMKDSFLTQAPDQEMPVNAFCTQKHLPTRFHLIFSHKTWVNGQRNPIDYEYKLCVDREKVLSESLHYYPEGEEQCVYIREDKKVIFGTNVSSISTSGLRGNSSIISYAAQDETQVIAKSCQAYLVHSNVTQKGLTEGHFNIEKMLADEYIQTRLPTFLQMADVGIETITLKKSDDEELNLLRGVIQNLDEDKKARIEKLVEKFPTQLNSNRLIFTHQIDGHRVDFSSQELESAGTLQFLALLYFMLSALKNGSLLILDEIELKLHPNLVAFLLGLFQNPSENPEGAQLIFSFHNTALMELLIPEQLWFAEKNDDGQTELFSAADFHDIKNLTKKNLENLYRIGRFGATPRGL